MEFQSFLAVFNPVIFFFSANTLLCTPSIFVVGRIEDYVPHFSKFHTLEGFCKILCKDFLHRTICDLVFSCLILICHEKVSYIEMLSSLCCPVILLCGYMNIMYC